MATSRIADSQMINSTELTYAAALLELAEESGQLDAIADEVRQLGGLLESQADLSGLLGSHILSTGERAQTVTRLFKGRVSDLLFRFLLVVNAKSRLGSLAGILHAFERLVQERHGVVEVQAHVPRPMDEAQAQRVATRLGQSLKRKVNLQQFVDPKLIGGLKLRVGDEIIDGSVAAQLRILKDKMVAEGQERARAKMRD